jgi:hypothetical protein
MAPTIDCAYVEINLFFDAFSSETHWKITKDSEGGEVVAESSYYDDWEYGGVFTIHSVCLPGDGIYTWTIEDLSGDGMCCEYGDGTYQVVSKDGVNGEAVIAEGGDFEFTESTTFAIPYGSTTVGGVPATLPPTTSPAPTVKCFDVEVSLTFDDYPYETMWFVTEGGANIQNDDNWMSSTVAKSPAYGMRETNSTVTQEVCLPTGDYTFLIIDSDGICCSYGEGSYSLSSVKKNGSREVIKVGGEFSAFESVTFSLPYVSVASPTPPSAPTATTPPPVPAVQTSPYWLDIDLKFDAYPYETLWAVCSGSSTCLQNQKQNVIEESPYYNLSFKDSSKSHRVYLQEGEYTYIIADKGGDGICCSFGNGSYEVTVHDDTNDVVIAQGSNFGLEDSVTFSVPYRQGSVPTPANVPTPSVKDTAPPTVEGCIPMNIDLMFDVFPYDTRWWLIEGDLKSFQEGNPTFVAKSPSPSYDVERFGSATHTYCLVEGRYTFLIFDDGGNGMCCKYGDGSFELSHGPEKDVFANGGKFNFFDIITFDVPFPSRSPSWTPEPTSAQPTIFGTPTPSVGFVPECIILLEVYTETDGDQDEIRWEVSLGSQSTVDSSFAIIVAQSEDSQYQISRMNGERSYDSDRVCLPGDGQYTFTIFDSNSGGDSRYRLVVDGALLASGSGFDFVESTTFIVPVTGQPTPSPNTGGAPPDVLCTMIDVAITFDEFSDETYWMVVEGDESALDNADVVVVADSPFYDPADYNATETKHHKVCLPGDGEYTFVIYDNAMDGMCCDFGAGGYKVASKDGSQITIAEGGQFGESEATTFTVPIVSAPSSSPTSTPRPTLSMSPTVDCERVEVSVTFDAFSSETSWIIVQDDTNTTVAESPFYSNWEYGNSTVSEIVCLPTEGSYTFTLVDDSGDGFCCAGYGDGSFSLVYKGDTSDTVISDKGSDASFQFYDSVPFIVPYVIPPTMRPTVSPAPTISTAPTPQCIPMEVVINFDSYPEDTLWEITEGDKNSWDYDDAVKVAESPIYSNANMLNTITHSICLPGEGRYTVTVFDGTGNGMCCEEGTGGYILLLIDDKGDRQIVAEGAEFEWMTSTSFDLPITADPRNDFW